MSLARTMASPFFFLALAAIRAPDSSTKSGHVYAVYTMGDGMDCEPCHPAAGTLRRDRSVQICGFCDMLPPSHPHSVHATIAWPGSCQFSL